MQESKWKEYWNKLAQIRTIKAWVENKYGDLYFFDESGFSLDSNVPYRWSKVNEPTPIPANRFAKRINVLGFLNTKNSDLVYKMTTDKVDSEVVVDLFNSFAKNLKNTTVVILDNASTHTSKLFKSNLERWEKEGLYLLYLPPYSPELNLIEILWREMKYRWVDIEALLSFDTLSVHIKKLLDGFGSEYVINFS